MPRRGPAIGLLLAASVVAAGVACRRRELAPPPPPPKPALASVEVDDVSAPSSAVSDPLDVDAAETSVRERLVATGLFASGAADGGVRPSARARVIVGVEPVEVGSKGELQARVRLRIDSRPSDAPGAINLDLEGRGVEPYVAAPGGKRRPSRARLALRVANDLVDGFAARRRLHDGPPSAVHAALVADAGELREEAIRAVGARQLRDEAPALLKLLSDPDEVIRDAALGALIELRDRRAVTELTRSRSLRDRREMRKIIEAIAMLGGQEAEDYLSFVAATHDDDEIRGAAAAARSRLSRRAEAGAAAAGSPGGPAN